MRAPLKGVESGNQADGIVSKELRHLVARVDWARTVGARLRFEAREMTAVGSQDEGNGREDATGTIVWGSFLRQRISFTTGIPR